MDDRALPRPGCPIRESPDQSLFSGSPKLIAASHVFHRHPTPRHPPFALSSLAINLFNLCATISFIAGAYEIYYYYLITPYSVFKERFNLEPSSQRALSSKLKTESPRLYELSAFNLKLRISIWWR